MCVLDDRLEERQVHYDEKNYLSRAELRPGDRKLSELQQSL